MAELKKDPFLGPKNVFMLVKDEAQTMYHNKFQGGISSVEHGYTCTILSERMYRLPFEE